MATNKTLKSTNAFAKEYDDHIQTKTWFAPEVIFGLLYAYIKPGDILLDIGIGTGLSALPFHRAGLEIYGVDGSEEMIRICQSKGFVQELKQVDLCHFKPPLFNNLFDIIISVGVFHFFEDLGPLIREISERTKTSGMFGFTTFRFEPEKDDGFISTTVDGVYQKIATHLDIQMYQHDPDYVTETLRKNDFIRLKKIEFLAFQDPDEHSEYYLSGYITQKK